MDNRRTQLSKRIGHMQDNQGIDPHCQSGRNQT